MKRPNTLLSMLLTASLTFLISCGSSGTANTSSSDSTNLPQAEIIQGDASTGDVITIESSALFTELKGDIPSLTEKYEGKRILIKNLLLAGGFTKTYSSGTKRKIYCVPVSSDNKMGYLHPDYAAKLEHMKSFKEIYASWRPNGFTKGSMDASNSTYYLGNTKLTNQYDHVQESNNILIEATLQNASDYPTMKLPIMHPVSDIVNGIDPNYLMSFTETFDMECTVSSLEGGPSSGEGIYVYDAVILNKKSFPATEIASIAKQTKATTEKGEQVKEEERQKREIFGQWNGKAGNSEVEFNLTQDGETIVAEVNYNGNSYIVEGNKAHTTNGWKITFTSNDEEGGVGGELVYDFKKSTNEMSIKINSDRGKVTRQ